MNCFATPLLMDELNLLIFKLLLISDCINKQLIPHDHLTIRPLQSFIGHNGNAYNCFMQYHTMHTACYIAPLGKGCSVEDL